MVGFIAYGLIIIICPRPRRGADKRHIPPLFHTIITPGFHSPESALNEPLVKTPFGRISPPSCGRRAAPPSCPGPRSGRIIHDIWLHPILNTSREVATLGKWSVEGGGHGKLSGSPGRPKLPSAVVVTARIFQGLFLNEVFRYQPPGGRGGRLVTGDSYFL